MLEVKYYSFCTNNNSYLTTSAMEAVQAWELENAEELKPIYKYFGAAKVKSYAEWPPLVTDQMKNLTPFPKGVTVKEWHRKEAETHVDEDFLIARLSRIIRPLTVMGLSHWSPRRLMNGDFY